MFQIWLSQFHPLYICPMAHILQKNSYLISAIFLHEFGLTEVLKDTQNKVC